MLEALDRYRFGILAVLGSFMLIFSYLKIQSYEKVFEIEGYGSTGRIMPEEEFQLKPENIEVPQNYDEDILNMADNVSDKRETSLDEFYENKTPAQVAKDIKALEQQMKNDAGGSEERAKLQAMIDARKEQKEKMEAAGTDDPKATDGGDKKYGGQTMVSYDLDGREPFQNNKYYVRNPGYKCDNGTRVTVVVDIKVNSSGNVTSATYNPGKSSGASSCEIREAIKYAKLSRFEYKGSGQNVGWIKYKFMPK